MRGTGHRDTRQREWGALWSEHHDRWRLVGVLARENKLAVILPVLKGRVRRARDHKVPLKDVAGSAATRVCREQPRNRVGFGEALTWAQPRRWAPAPCRAAGTPSAAGTSTPSTRHPCLRSVYTRGHVSVFREKQWVKPVFSHEQNSCRFPPQWRPATFAAPAQHCQTSGLTAFASSVSTRAFRGADMRVRPLRTKLERRLFPQRQ